MWVSVLFVRLCEHLLHARTNIRTHRETGTPEVIGQVPPGQRRGHGSHAAVSCVVSRVCGVIAMTLAHQVVIAVPINLNTALRGVDLVYGLFCC